MKENKCCMATLKNEWERHIDFLERYVECFETAGDDFASRLMQDELNNCLNWYDKIFGGKPTNKFKQLEIYEEERYLPILWTRS